MERNSPANPDTPEASAAVPDRPDAEHFDAAIAHVDHSYAKGVMAAGAAKGILYSVIETLGTLVGDPDLPEHARSGYQALLVSARELRTRID
jgi:hypothetical protein